jgi:hypothetical protein
VKRWLLGLIVVSGLLTTVAAAAPTQTVTIQGKRFLSQACCGFTFRFSGAISSGAPNEDVAVHGKRCGFRDWTMVAQASTRAGGFWSVESGRLSSATNMFQARWNGHSSQPLIFREPAPMSFYRQSRRRWGITVFSSRNLRGRFVELQRLSAGTWTRVRRLRLVPTPRKKGFYAIFPVRQRGLTLRIFVPQATAAPCYTPTATKTFYS